MPAKKTPTKQETVKETAKKVVKKTEKKIDEVKKQFEQEAKFVKEESKEIMGDIEKWWHKSSTEEKIYTILGIISLIGGLILLRKMIWGMLLVILGLLFVTGYFVKKE